MTTEQAPTQKRKITIGKVDEPKLINPEKGTKKLQFKGTGEDGKELAYFTFRSDLFPAIVTGKVVEVEFTESHREWDGNPITDRKVNQVIIDGQPVAQGKGFGGKSWGQSPETLDLRHKHDLALEAFKQTHWNRTKAIEEIGLAIRANSHLPNGIVPAYWATITSMLGVKPLPANGVKQDGVEDLFPKKQS